MAGGETYPGQGQGDGGVNNAELGGKRRFGKLTVGDKKGEGAEGEGKKGGGGRKRRSRHGRRFLPEGRFMISKLVPMFCATEFEERKIEK